MSRLAPMSTPLVGSLSRSTRGSDARARAMTTFCWLPPDSVVIASWSRPSRIFSRPEYAANLADARRTEISPPRASFERVAAVKFSLMDSGGKIDSSRRSLAT